jgi:hypothetical protein
MPWLETVGESLPLKCGVVGGARRRIDGESPITLNISADTASVARSLPIAATIHRHTL